LKDLSGMHLPIHRLDAPMALAIKKELFRILEQKEFMAVLFQCLEHLPDRLHRLFVLRELENMESDEICKDLEITPTNLWVMLHRARLRLRGCLTENWFGGEAC
ncbi:MAG: sigma factor-like helix-turn-helix DNA-binding protein, partial [Verrucomicrobiota bacterium]|nr:sigma factor-like helix-turn-helix DNA-binding protein [Verrucomicrobiota bacterium]